MSYARIAWTRRRARARSAPSALPTDEALVACSVVASSQSWGRPRGRTPAPNTSPPGVRPSYMVRARAVVMSEQKVTLGHGELGSGRGLYQLPVDGHGERVGIHPHDVAQLLDERGIAVRAGHHCARPVCVRYGIPATTRASFGVYTTTEEIDALVSGVARVREVFA